MTQRRCTWPSATRDVMRWWNTPIRVEVADTRRDLVNSLDGEDAHMWVVHEAGQPVGLVGLLGDVAVPGLSWLLCRQAWGRGLMAEAAGRGSRARVRITGFCPGRSLGGGRQTSAPFRRRAGSASPNAVGSRNGIRTATNHTNRSFSVGLANQNPPQCSVSRSLFQFSMSPRSSTYCGPYWARGRSMARAIRRP